MGLCLCVMTCVSYDLHLTFGFVLFSRLVHESIILFGLLQYHSRRLIISFPDNIDILEYYKIEKSMILIVGYCFCYLLIMGKLPMVLFDRMTMS